MVLQILNSKETGFVLELFVITHLLSISEEKSYPLRRNNSSLFIIFIIITVLKTPLWKRHGIRSVIKDEQISLGLSDVETS